MNAKIKSDPDSLVRAAINDDAKQCELLISHGVAVDDLGRRKRTALSLASENGCAHAAKKLLACGANPNWIVPDRDPEVAGHSCLTLAAKNDHLEVARILVKGGANIDFQRRGGGTALSYAAAHGHAKVVVFLLTAGAHPDKYDLDGPCRLGHEKIVALLLRAGADPNRQDHTKDSVLSKAAANGHIGVVKVLVKHGGNINAKDWGLTPLMHAIICGQTKVALWLLRNGADPNVRDNGKRSALHFAVKQRNGVVIRALVRNGVDVSIRDNKGVSALVNPTRQP